MKTFIADLYKLRNAAQSCGVKPSIVDRISIEISVQELRELGRYGFSYPSLPTILNPKLLGFSIVIVDRAEMSMALEETG